MIGNTIRNEIVEGRGVLADEGRGLGVSRRFCLCDLAEKALVVDESLEFSLRDIIGIDIFNPRTVECIIRPSPKRINQGNQRWVPYQAS